VEHITVSRTLNSIVRQDEPRNSLPCCILVDVQLAFFRDWNKSKGKKKMSIQEVTLLGTSTTVSSKVAIVPGEAIGSEKRPFCGPFTERFLEYQDRIAHALWKRSIFWMKTDQEYPLPLTIALKRTNVSTYRDRATDTQNSGIRFILAATITVRRPRSVMGKRVLPGPMDRDTPMGLEDQLYRQRSLSNAQLHGRDRSMSNSSACSLC
jgi:hypothetical protein